MARFLQVLLLAVVAGVAAAAEDWGDADYDFDYDPRLKRTWREGAVTLPPPPGEDLLEARRAPTTGGRLWVDPRALRSGRDGVVRLTYVVESEDGVRTVRFEGLRCDTRQYRGYAYLDHRGRWRRPAEAPWRPIRERGLNTYRYDLYRFYLCDADDLPRSRREILRRLRYAVEDHEP